MQSEYAPHMLSHSMTSKGLDNYTSETHVTIYQNTPHMLSHALTSHPTTQSTWESIIILTIQNI